MNWQAWRDFFITAFLLGLAFILALLSSIAAERNDVKHAAIAAAVSLLLALLGALYIIPRLARNVRLEILRFAVRTTVTVEGLLFIILLAVIAFAAWNTGNNLLYLILSAMLAFLIAANLIARVSLADMAVQLRFPDHIFAGEPANLTVTLISHKRLMPSYSLMIEALSDAPPRDGGGAEDLAKAEQAREETRGRAKPALSSRPVPSQAAPVALGRLAYFALVPASASARQRIEYTFERRGRYPITGFRLSTKFPANFFKKWRRIDATGELIVYPKPQALDDFYHALPMIAGQIQSHNRGSGDDLYAIRRYHPSDHIRYIDWKATAKSMEMMVRENMREDEWRLTIVLDTSHPSERLVAGGKAAEPDPAAEAEFERRFERAVVMAASLANHFMLERAEVELITPLPEHNVRSGADHDHLYKILRSLATLQPTYSPAWEEPARKREPRRRLFGRERRSTGAAEDSAAIRPKAEKGWRLLDEVPVLGDERRFKVLITSAAKGTIPANVWRSAHVVFMEDL